jgi:hypothetical protein
MAARTTGFPPPPLTLQPGVTQVHVITGLVPVIPTV